MRIRTLLVIVAILLLAVFVALNFSAFTVSAPLNLLVTTVEAPPALVMLVILALGGLAGAVYMALWQAQILVESRRHAKELHAQRQLADQAEASRITDLRTAMTEQSARLAERMTGTQEALRREIHEQVSSLAAMIGELGDRSGAGTKLVGD